MQDPWLPFASSLCGACAEVCPVKIDIPKLLLKLRAEVTEQQGGSERRGFRLFAWLMRHPMLYRLFGKIVAKFTPRPQDGGWINRLPRFMHVGPLKNWMSQRDLPPPSKTHFHNYWKERSK